jgi:sigma-B regulation protein RsbU (phosphoserine phosphatase)
MSKKILIVDDDILSRELLWGYLTGENYEIWTASNAAEARTIMHKTGPDLVLLDVMMPGEDGFSFCRYIKDKWQEPFLPVILITALNDRNSKLQGLNSGADDFLTKPVDRIELLIKVRNMLKTRELHANLYTELLFARRVQENLFFTGSRLSNDERLFYQPCRQVGGDLIETWKQEGSLWALLADAAGHGPSAALIATAVKALIDKNATTPGNLLQQLNHSLCSLLANEDTTYYVTCICIKAQENLMTWAGAGHPPCMLKSRGEVIPLNSQSMPLGIIPGQSFEENSVPHQTGDLLLLYSDGLFDIVSEKELYELLKQMDLKQAIYEQLEKKIRQGSPTDDIAFLGLSL